MLGIALDQQFGLWWALTQAQKIVQDWPSVVNSVKAEGLYHRISIKVDLK